MQFSISAEHAAKIRWSARGSCGNSGCTDPECGCSICGKPIGVPEDDPRWETHDEYCDGCDLCVDEVPLIMWKEDVDGRTLQAQFHTDCSGVIIENADPS